MKSSSFRSALRGIEAAAQVRVGRVGEEPGAEDGDGLLDAVAELIERPLALLRGEPAPLLQVAGRGAAVALDREPGLVAGQVEQHEVGEQLAVEDRLEVELDVGGADERGRVAQQPQRGAVGQDRPQVGVVAVEEFLEHGLRRAGGDVRGLVVQVGGPAEQVDRHVPGPVADREALALQLEAAPGHLVEAELAQEDAQPPFPGDPRRHGLGRTGAFDPALEVLPDLQQVEPGPGGLPPDRLAALKAVGLRPGARHLRVAGGHAAEQVGGEQAADDLQGAERGHDAAPPAAGR